MAELFSATERARIESTIQAVEQCTAGEIVVAVVERSDDYDGPRAALAVAGCLALTAIALHFWPGATATDWRISTLVLAQAAVIAGLWWLLGRSVLLRLWLPTATMAAAVMRRAMQHFIAAGVHQTRDASGILIFIAHTEHRVVMLGDRGIHAKVGTEGWQQHVQTLTEGLRQGRAGDALCAVLEALGAELAAHFPPRDDDIDELPNRVEQHQR
ncbi:MAG: TPM domain-containing protein [Polyangiales bacterium]